LQVEEWHFHYAKASTTLTDRVAMLRNTAALVENNLTLLGSTGIEDKLQVMLEFIENMYITFYLQGSSDSFLSLSLT
jgi:hypothetical protein